MTVLPPDPHDDPEKGIVVSHASFAYRTKVVLEDLDLVIRPGSITYLIGPNGSGKSTFLRGLGGLLSPVSGSIKVHGRPADEHRGRTAFVVQESQGDRRVPVSVREVVTMGRYPALGLFHRPRVADTDAVDTAIERMGLQDIAGALLRELSGGQRQRTFIAQALAQDADVLLLDEPMSALDTPSREGVMEVLTEERNFGRTVVVSTHELTDAAGGDDVLILQGRAVAFGPPKQVLIPSVLADAYGGRVLHIDEMTMLLDDGPHHHDHTHP